MKDTAKKFEQKFLPYKLPEKLKALADYWDSHPEFFSGSFEVDSDEYNSAVDWFRKNEAGYSKVKVFGIDGIHSLYAFWTAEESDLEKCPIVYLGGEGEGTAVIAENFDALLSILASNREYEPFDKDFMEEETSNTEENRRFRKWLQKNYNILPAKNPLSLMKKAQKKFPEFQKWLKTVIPGWR